MGGRPGPCAFLGGKVARSGVAQSPKSAAKQAALILFKSSPHPRGSNAAESIGGLVKSGTAREIAMPCVFGVLRSKQRNGRVDPLHHDRVADFAGRGTGVVRGTFRYLIDRPAMGAGKIPSTLMSSHAIILTSKHAV